MSGLIGLKTQEKNILRVVSTKLDRLKRKIKRLYKEEDFNFKESASALKKFARQFTNKGKSGFFPREFLNAVKSKK